MNPTDFEFALRLLLATGCGLMIGLERQFRSRTAGLRTQALVAAGAAVFVLFGEQAGVPQAPLQCRAPGLASIHRSGWGSNGALNRECLACQGKLYLRQCKSSREERHLVDASFPQRAGCLRVI
ncbi:hypothetical protein E3O51_06560 [Cryobacterium sp. MDB2-10]|uniref:MgtC/SapB/SrpB/YhiD N-terminal domain-containing protein n=1 Tax=Cryobacterium glucosi TaxID=1259175 RepID=A0ABY2IKH5_9MICO|nr:MULTISPECIES: MgtC/SapB family protein [Cryobacterium]TFB92023.1 hypothetical protein E3O39_18450 [Cryobacterium sp. MDB2-A-1]TFC07576.1 hypothetical protein E3O59_09560 [Cryobacterium sp. MDB2-33-2]TFC08949.1 hypothetical protein E3O35_15760 [Cryobacterium sp. MDB2-A-2]TFC19045.1 hypothetical protein E3O46_12950 [Cryobacterium glucosi]TFC19464.1 hypothetical protein E3O51_06560 [Cryobacterium sp. MDB2-10]